MGSAQCCQKVVQQESQEVVIVEEVSKPEPNQQETIAQIIKHKNKKTEECGTPGFPELMSQQSKRSEHQSMKDIQLVGQIEKEDHVFKSSSTLGKKRNNDSPIVAFEAKNSLKSLDLNKLKKLQTVTEQQLRSKDISSQNDEDSIRADSNRSDDPQKKAILKQEMKYSRFRGQQSDNQSRKVKFNLE